MTVMTLRVAVIRVICVGLSPRPCSADQARRMIEEASRCGYSAHEGRSFGRQMPEADPARVRQ